jgi:MFS superfamily sulfate permease-like transporter
MSLGSWLHASSSKPGSGRALRLSRSELSGAFADLGVLVPLEAALIAVNGLNPTSTLLGVGIAYIAAGWYFRLPMPVQPLKALAAIAIARELSPDVIAAGALLMSLSLVALAITGAIDKIYAVIPVPVVRGVQLGLAYVLVRGAFNLLEKPLSPDAPQMSLAIGFAALPLMLVLAPLFLLAVVLLLKRPVVPASVAVLAVGVGVGVYVGRWHGGALGPAPVGFAFPSADAFALAAAVLLTAQLPLTIANSVVATADAAGVYFPDQSARVTPRRLSVSIALGNLWAGLLGGLPLCHGSGGMTAHYMMGARTPASTALLGAVLVAAALLFGGAAQSIRTLVPLPFFGILLLFVGVQHAALAMQVRRSELAYVLLAGVLAVLFDGNLAYAAALTLGAYWALEGFQRVVLRTSG